MYKIIHNNLIIDVMEKLRYVRYLPKSQRTVGTDRLAATGIMSSNGEEIYHLEGKLDNFPEKLKTVQVIKIDEKEFKKLTTELTFQKEQVIDNNNLQEQIDALAAMVNQLSQQNFNLIAQINEMNK